jgi:hypothetical protein
MRKPGSKERIRRFFLRNIGKIVTSIQLRNAAGSGVSEWARRVRELREDEKWPILTHNDRADLKPGEYFLAGPPPERAGVSFSRPISAKTRAEVLDRNGFTCQMCGLTPGDIDPIKDKSLGGLDELSNLRALCSTCNQGAKNITSEKPTWIWLLAQIRRAGQDDQRAAFDWLSKKFGTDDEGG